MKRLGFSCAEVKTLGMVEGLKQAGYTCAEAKQAGYTCAEAKQAGYVQGLKQAGYTCAEAKQAGYTPKQCRDAGYGNEDIQSAGWAQRSWDTW